MKTFIHTIFILMYIFIVCIPIGKTDKLKDAYILFNYIFGAAIVVIGHIGLIRMVNDQLKTEKDFKEKKDVWIMQAL